jgi:Plasmid pRiA4b ORF-3-like protein
MEELRCSSTANDNLASSYLIASMARVYDLDLELRGAVPRVVRRVRLPGDVSLADLHRVIQVVMGWDDVHPHVFDVGGREYGPEPDEEEVSLHWAGDDEHVTIAKAVQKDRTFEYTYDFGAEHRIDISVSAEHASAPYRIECVGGEGAWFDRDDINQRLRDELRGHRAVAVPHEDLTPEDQLLSDLTLLLLFLSSWEEGKGTRVAYKTMKVELLDAMSDSGFLVTNSYRKSVELTPKGAQRAQQLLQRVAPLLRDLQS